MKSASQEQKALNVAVYGNFFMATLGLSFAWYTGSQAVLLDGVFSLIALVISLLTLYVARLLQRPNDDGFPFGYAVFEPILNLGKGLIIGAVMVVAFSGAVSTMLNGGSEIVVGGAVIYALLASAGCAAIVVFMRRMAKATESPIVAVEVKNWLIDGVISGVVALAFFIVMLLQGTAADPWLRYVDQVLVILMAIGFLAIPYGIIRDNWSQIVGSTPPDDLTEPVHQAVDKLLTQHGLSEHRLRLGQLGRQAYVQLYVIFTPEEALGIDASEMDEFRQQLYDILKKDYANLVIDVIFTQDAVWAERSVNSSS
jgi:cation diffusion facilitator family transporter